jgi:hypothetical protein
MVAPRGSLEFFIKMKHKPAQKDLLDRVASLTDEEIENCGQPAWIRKHLRTLRDRKGLTTNQSAAAIANLMQSNHIQLPDPKFAILEWTEPDIIVKPDGRGMAYDLQTGNIFLADTKAAQLKIEYSVLNVSSVRIQEFIKRSKIIGMMTDREYIEEVGRRKTLS